MPQAFPRTDHSSQTARAGVMGPAQMQPIVDRSYCTSHEQVFFLSESVMSLSGDDFTIRDGSNPSNYYRLDSAAFSMKGSRVLKDSGGRVVLNMRHKVRAGPPHPRSSSHHPE